MSETVDSAILPDVQAGSQAALSTSHDNVDIEMQDDEPEADTGKVAQYQDQMTAVRDNVADRSGPTSTVPFKRPLEISVYSDGVSNSASKHRLEDPGVKDDLDRSPDPTTDETRATPSIKMEDGLQISEVSSASAQTEQQAPNDIPNPTAAEVADFRPAATSVATNSVTSIVNSTSDSQAASHTNGDTTIKSTGSAARVYLKEQVNDFLLHGMRWLVTSRPENGLLALGQYLQSADEWRHESINSKKDHADFDKYWAQYQSWKDKNAGLTEAEYKKSIDS